jgi:predicted nucleic acid-binding protein
VASRGEDVTGIDSGEDELDARAYSTSRGLTAYDAAYVAAAEAAAAPLVTNDELVVSVAADVATGVSALGG